MVYDLRSGSDLSWCGTGKDVGKHLIDSAGDPVYAILAGKIGEIDFAVKNIVDGEDVRSTTTEAALTE